MKDNVFIIIVICGIVLISVLAYVFDFSNETDPNLYMTHVDCDTDVICYSNTENAVNHISCVYVPNNIYCEVGDHV